MKLSNLFTEDSMSEESTQRNNLQKITGRALKRLKTSPNPREARVNAIIRKIRQDVWGKYHGDRKAQRRIDKFKGAITQYMPELMAMRDDKELKRDIEAKFRAAAEGLALEPKSNSPGK